MRRIPQTQCSIIVTSLVLSLPTWGQFRSIHGGPLLLQERVRNTIQLGESHFREFKSALEGQANAKRPRLTKRISDDIAGAGQGDRKPFCFIFFNDEDSVARAVAKLDGHWFYGSELRVRVYREESRRFPRM